MQEVLKPFQPQFNSSLTMPAVIASLVFVPAKRKQTRQKFVGHNREGFEPSRIQTFSFAGNFPGNGLVVDPACALRPGR